MATPGMNAYPSTTDLVDGMTNSLGCTENWDVVVSYSLDKLNDILQKVWAQKVTAQKFSVTSEDEDQFTGDTIYTTWLLTLGRPTLQFSAENDGKAILTMSLSGTHQAQESGKTGPVLSIPEGTFEFVAKVDINGVQLVNGKPVDQTSTSQVMQFTDKPGADAYIIFSFGTASSIYGIQAVPGSSAPVPSNFSVGLRDSLAAWMQDPRHVNSIDIALATINNKSREGLSFLTPQAAAFSVFASPNKGQPNKVGCLSIYIQTQRPNSQPGNTSRLFQLPGNKNINTYPISDGYTASVIIKHDVFYSSFLEYQLTTLKNTNGKLIFREVLPAATNEGFQLYLRLADGVAGDFSEHSWWGDLDVENINWDLGRDQINFTIDKHAQQHWNYYFADQLKWAMTYAEKWGKTYYDLSLRRDAPLAIANNDPSSGTQIYSQIAIDKGNWNPWVHVWNPGPGDFGAIRQIPGEVSRGLNSLVLPTFSASIGLDYTATTNIFAPGKSMTKFSSTQDMYAPYDVLLLGNIIEPTGLHNSKLLETVFAKSGLSDDNIKSTADFVQDLIAGKPVYGQAVAALATGDPDKVNSFMNQSGYDIQSAGLKAALVTANPGPDFDIRQVGGAYSFNRPADLKDSVMKVIPASARLYIDDIYTSNTTDARGHVVFNLKGYKYDIVFSPSYDENGFTANVTFDGTRARPDGTEEAEVSGAQILNPPAAYWTAETWAATASFVATLFGTGLTLVLWLYDKHKDRKEKEDAAKAATRRVQQGAHDAEDGVEMALLNNRRSSSVDPATFQPTVERKVREQVNKDVALNSPAQQTVQNALDVAKSTTIQLQAGSQGGAVESVRGFENLVGRDVVKAANQKVAENAVRGILRALETTPYINSVVNAQTMRNNVAQARSRANDARDQQSSLERQIQNEQKTRDKVQQLMEERKEEIEKKGLDPNTDQQMKDLQRQLKELTDRMGRDQAAANERQQEARDQDKKGDQDEREEKKYDDDAAGSSGITFHGDRDIVKALESQSLS